MNNLDYTYFDRCAHGSDPFYLLECRRLKIGYIVYKVKCLECGKEFEIYTTERRSHLPGMVYKTIEEKPYKKQCDWSYEDVKEAYDLMKEQTKTRPGYGFLYLSYFLRESFSYDNNK